MDEPFGALDPLTRDALGDDTAPSRKLGVTTVMITHDMTEAILWQTAFPVMRSGRLLAQGTPAELTQSKDAYVMSCCAATRQAERLGALLPRTARMSLFTDPAGPRRSPTCPTISATSRVSVTALALRGSRSASPWRLPRAPSVSPASCSARQHRADLPGLALLALFYPLLWRWRR